MTCATHIDANDTDVTRTNGGALVRGSLRPLFFALLMRLVARCFRVMPGVALAPLSIFVQSGYGGRIRPSSMMADVRARHALGEHYGFDELK